MNVPVPCSPFPAPRSLLFTLVIEGPAQKGDIIVWKDFNTGEIIHSAWIKTPVGDIGALDPDLSILHSKNGQLTFTPNTTLRAVDKTYDGDGILKMVWREK